MNKIKNLIKEIVGIYFEKRIPVYSAQCAYYMILSILPFIILVMLLIQYFPMEDPGVMDFFHFYFPEEVYGIVSGVVENLYNTSNIFILIFGIIAALWASGRTMFCIRGGLNEIYDVNETRNYFYVRFIAIVYALLLALVVVISVVLMLFGNNILNGLIQVFPWLAGHETVIDVFRFTFSFIIITLLFMLFYAYLSNQKKTFIYQLPGAVFATLGWVVLSYLFSLYFRFGTNLYTLYGSLAGIMMFMLWLVTCMYVFFIGAAINSARIITWKRKHRFLVRGSELNDEYFELEQLAEDFETEIDILEEDIRDYEADKNERGKTNSGN